MSFNVQNFLSKVNEAGGLVQNNKFALTITPPPIFKSTSNYNEDVKAKLEDGAKNLVYFCSSASIPGVTLNTHEIRRYGYGPNEKRPYTVSFSDATFNIYFDSKRKNYDFFQTWISSIMDYDVNNSTNSKFLLEYKSEYHSTVDLLVHDNTGTEIAHYVMDEAFPISIGDIPLNWGDTNSIIRIPVTFTFFTWSNELVKSAARFEETSSRVPDLAGQIVKQTQQVIAATGNVLNGDSNAVQNFGD
jgi:hypothetical protein